MKISKSKQELARIISENGGWREMAGSAAQCAGGEISFWHDVATKRHGEDWRGSYLGSCEDIEFTGVKLPNWHQTILSSEEYFHLCPAPDADGWIEWKGGECPVEPSTKIGVRYRNGGEFHSIITAASQRWSNNGWPADIIAYRLHKPDVKPEFCESVMRSIPEPESIDGLCAKVTEENKHQYVDAKQTIEKLAQDYRNAKDYAERKQQEADDANADADAILKALEIAGEALGLLVSPITEKQEPEPELVTTDWHDLQTGDVISVSGKWWEPDSEYTVDENDGSRDAPIRVGGYWALIGECSFKFIRRP